MSELQDVSTSAAMARPTSVACNRPRLMKACREVEGLFLSRLLEAMDKPAFGDGILGNSNASTLFRARRNQAIADEMGRRGDIGLADMLYEDLSHSHDAATSDSESVSDQGGTER